MKSKRNTSDQVRWQAPRQLTRFIKWLVAPHLREEILGDLQERYEHRVKTQGEARARRRYWLESLAYMRPAFIKRQKSEYPSTPFYNLYMIGNYLKTALRNLVKNKALSFINIAGLSVGMAVVLLIGHWLWDELSFDKYHQNYDRIAQVMQSQVLSGELKTQVQVPIPMGSYLRTKYGSDFKQVVLSTNTQTHILASGEKKFTRTGNFIEAEGPALLTLNMVHGSRDGLKDPASILLCQSVATALFGEADIIGNIVRFDDNMNLKVTGVYEDLPGNTTLSNVLFMASWQLQKRLKENDNWGNNGWLVYVQLADNADLNAVSTKIRDAKYVANNRDERYKSVMFLHPMSKWHLYSEFKDGINTGGRIRYVWLFGITGIFVLLLACINFMNLSTARSEKRAKEVGIRKSIGSLRGQLVYQFYSESLLTAIFSFLFSLALVLVLLPVFNTMAGKNISIAWANPFFWLLCIAFTLFTGIIAGSYPALYLSSFQPVKVLKGTFRAGRFASVPRKVLVVMQFTFSVILIIGTIVVFRQIQFAKNRPVGYNREGLLNVGVITPDIYNHYDAFRNDLLQTGAVTEVAASSYAVTETSNQQGNFDWDGKDKNGSENFFTLGVSQTFGKTIGWQFTQGRDYLTGPAGADAMGLVFNESAVKLAGFKNPIGKTIRWYGYTFNIIGVVKDMVMQSPFDPTEPTIFFMAPSRVNQYNVKINPDVSISTAIGKIEAVFKKYSPSQPFDYKFVDDEYAHKFAAEEKVGQLATFFAVLAIFISCLGLFGMASFMAEQRIKEIGVRKVLGASVFGLWGLLSKDFVVLVMASMLIAMPTAYYLMSDWLGHYQYRTGIEWWIFMVTAGGAMLVTLLTVSYQSIKAALMNPVKSLRSE